MILLLASEPDIASMNIRTAVLGCAPWKSTERFDNNEVYTYDKFTLVTIKSLHIFAENFDQKLRDAGFSFDTIIVLSRHKSETALPTLTAHPVGNFGNAAFGGRDFTVCPAAPAMMGACMRYLSRNSGSSSAYRISLEVTHHGPYVETPLMFIEIGSDEARWNDREAAVWIANTVMNAERREYPVVVGIGGGHYAPRFTDILLTKKVNFSHMIPEYAIPELKIETLEGVLSKPKPDFVYVHEKGLKKENLRKIQGMLDNFDIKACSSKDFETLD